MFKYIQTMLYFFFVCICETRLNPRFLQNLSAPDKSFHVVSDDMSITYHLAAVAHRFILIAVNHLAKWVKAAFPLVYPQR